MFGSWARGEANSDSDLDLLVLTLPSLKAWGFSLLRESLESTELNPDTFPDLKRRGLRPMIFGSSAIATSPYYKCDRLPSRIIKAENCFLLGGEG
ncbi:MAG: hypothetical protein BRC39_17505 [Cyanobacteria bacterium QH_7_48_89]|nr:MAG: hypothetical protein BRC39_17505 [Cyanobacteria bacterium QH_7_48_89]